MTAISLRVQAIQTALDDKYPEGKNSRPFGIVQTVNSLMKTFQLTPDEMEQVVDTTKQKLEGALRDKRNKCSTDLGSLELYKQENQRTKTVTFMADHKAKVVNILSGEALDSSEDYTKMQEMYERLEMRRYMHK